MKRLFLTLGLATSMLHAEPLFLLEFSGTAGPYTVEQWKKDWPGCEYEDGLAEGHGSLVLREGKPWLRVLYPKGSVGADKGGAGWRFPFGTHEAAELRYEVRLGDVVNGVTLGSAADFARDHGLQLGADAYLIRPIEPERLLARMRARFLA